MQQVVELLESNIAFIILGLGVVNFVFFMLIIVLFIKNSKLKKRYNEFMRGSEIDIEALLRESIEKSTSVEESHKYIKDSIDRMQVQLNECVQKVGIVRYAAIAGTGADLSFAVAFLDDKDNGVVLNGIYTRDGSYTYAKEIRAGKSKHTLSDEENEAITIAKQNPQV